LAVLYARFYVNDDDHVQE